MGVDGLKWTMCREEEKKREEKRRMTRDEHSPSLSPLQTNTIMSKGYSRISKAPFPSPLFCLKKKEVYSFRSGLKRGNLGRDARTYFCRSSTLECISVLLSLFRFLFCAFYNEQGRAYTSTSNKGANIQTTIHALMNER